MTYSPPLADIRFILNHLIGIDKLAALPGYEATSPDLVESVLEAAGKLASETFAPLNQVGDKNKAKLTEKGIVMPEGFRAAYQAYVEGGWNGLPFDPDHGGQGLPWCIAMPVQEMWQSANLALALCTLLNQGTIEAMEAHGSDALKKIYLEKLVSGTWTGTMNLTEPQAGSDVGAVRCKAVRAGDHYKITGQKIFISYGDHDIAENIVHLVLARLPDAPEGTKGLSLFLVPKLLPNADGSPGAVNDVRVVSTEHKLGQHASPTCVMAYGDQGGATGYLVGEEQGGIAAMFTMMNNARIGVGIQGLALAERAYQGAREYAKTRVQSRDIAKPKDAPVTIIHHPDVRRMLLGMKAQIEAGRALAMAGAYALDRAKHAPDADEREKAGLRVDLLTPVIKSWLTDMSNEVTSTAMQVFGGMGYIEETGAAQHMRDARVLAIYEGTNGIQANDLVFRKLGRDKGAAMNAMLEEIEELTGTLAAQKGDDLASIATHLKAAHACTQEAGQWMLDTMKGNPSAAAASAAPYLRLCAYTFGGYYLGQSALIAQQLLASNDGDAGFLNAKIMSARFFAEHFLTQAAGLRDTVKLGFRATLAMTAEMF
ncbi:MAG: acyl-CoA dehydrogenase [Alphaproteobacteria bacterium]|nr:acyl-CoA dehydrogenase [Alphaproteobacteria bacterium]